MGLHQHPVSLVCHIALLLASPNAAEAASEPTVFEAPEAPESEQAVEFEVPAEPEAAPAPAEEASDESQEDRPSVTLDFKEGKGVTVLSSDGRFLLEPSLRAQMLAFYRDGDVSSEQSGVLIRRARLQFQGHAFGEANQYKIELAVAPNDLRFDTDAIDGEQFPTETPLLSWYYQFAASQNLELRVGQYKIPFSRQRVVSSGRLQFVDRSEANREFNLDRDVGLDIRSENLFGANLVRYYFGFYNGLGRSPQSFGPHGALLLGRVEVSPTRRFAAMSEGVVAFPDQPQTSLGIAYAKSSDDFGERVNRGTAYEEDNRVRTRTWTTDASFQYKGFAGTGEFFYRDTQADDSVQPGRSGQGWFGQLGFRPARAWPEFAARYGEVIGLGASSIEDLNELAFGISQYFHRHALKVQADWTRLDAASGSGDQARIQLQMQF